MGLCYPTAYLSCFSVLPKVQDQVTASGVKVGRTGGHRKSATGRGWMMRLDRPRVRVGFTAAMVRKMGGIGRDGKTGRGEIRLSWLSSGTSIHLRAVKAHWRVMPAIDTLCWSDSESKFIPDARVRFSLFSGISPVVPVLRGSQILGLSMMWWPRRDQAPIRGRTLSPVAVHALFCDFFYDSPSMLNPEILVPAGMWRTCSWSCPAIFTATTKFLGSTFSYSIGPPTTGLSLKS